MRRRTFLAASAGAASAVLAQSKPAPAAAPVRIGVIGLGNRGRGRGLLELLVKIPGVRVTALCDMNPEGLAKATQTVAKAGGPAPACFGKTPDDYHQLLARENVDAVLIATPTKWHCPMATAAMKAGKHVASEVPAGFTTEELWELVRTKEATGRRYMLLENYLYTQASLAVFNMARAGLFGEPYYAEAAYLHDCRFMLFRKDGSLDWWGEWAAKFHGSDYPTHALGPVSKWMGLNDGDRIARCTCLMTRPRVLKASAVHKYGADSPQGRIDWALGDYLAMTLATEAGRVIRIDYDVNSPRPPQFPYLLQGTQGVYDSRQGVYIEGRSPAEAWEPADPYLAEHQHAYWKTAGAEATAAGHGGGDYFVLRDFVEMARRDREPWIDVYDAASWSVLFDCSRHSIDQGGAAVAVPDFTAERWKDPAWRAAALRPL